MDLPHQNEIGVEENEIEVQKRADDQMKTNVFRNKFQRNTSPNCKFKKDDR